MTTKEYIFYRIVCKNPEIKECYVGSTTQFKNRKCAHKKSCNNENSTKYNYYIYQFIRDNSGWENWDMIEIEKQQLESTQESLKRERYWLEFYGSTLNTQIPTRTKTENYLAKKEYYNNKSKENYENNKEYYNELNKIYANNNKEKIDGYKQKYYEKNKNKKLEKNECCCGSIVSACGITRHKSSLKHQEFIKNNT